MQTLKTFSNDNSKIIIMIDVLKRNNVKILGQGNQTMIFAHGFGCDQNTWRYVIDSFKDSYKIVLFDYVGAGKSDLDSYDSKKYNSLKGYANDIIEICEVLNIKDAIFVGHSVSSMIGMLAAIEQPSYFSKMIFLGPSARYIHDNDYNGAMNQEDLLALLEVMDSNYLGWSQQMAPAIMGNPDKPSLGEDLTNSFCATNPDIAKDFARVTFLSDNRADLPLLQVQSLTLQCAEDVLAPEHSGQYIYENTPGNTMIQLKATGHCPHLSAPDEIITLIKSFIQ